MLKKILLSILLITVIGAGGTALVYNLSVQDAEAKEAAQELLTNGQGNGAQQTGGQTPQGAPNGAPIIAAEGAAGDPWNETGTITEIDDTGFQFALQNGETVYIELGPPDYWQNQGIDLQIGQSALVNGSINDGMIHATQIILADGQTLQVRSETGQPLWSGGVTNGQGQIAGQTDGEHTPEPKAQVDEWVTIAGTLMSFQGGNMTMSTSDGAIVTFQTGQPRFFAAQGITFNIGDEIVVVGFYQDDRFKAGDITQTATGLKVMLLDPNGRPLWAGPGGNGQR